MSIDDATPEEWQSLADRNYRENFKQRHPASARFHEILRELGELHDRKQADYGTDADPFANIRSSKDINVDPFLGCWIRTRDKVNRVNQFIRKGELKNESVEDSLRDMAVYAIIGLVMLEGK